MATVLLPGIFRTSSRLGTAWVLSHRVSWRVTQNSLFSTLSARREEQTRATSETMNVNHSQFLAEASPGAKWKSKPPKGAGSPNSGVFDPLNGNGFEKVAEGKGKLSPTSSHLFKLTLPLNRVQNAMKKSGSSKAACRLAPPTVLLLHPSQPLSHVSRLILASLAPSVPSISFQNRSTSGQTIQWSHSTDIGDFIKDAARQAEFSIHFTHEDNRTTTTAQRKNDDTCDVGEEGEWEQAETVIEVEVPTFADRTRFMRRRLEFVKERLTEMEVLKKECDYAAHQGARRMALSGFGMLVVYWGLVARLTFWDFGWDVMEPITYLSGLSTVICGYLWFLYQGREVSYSSILSRSISTRREVLYKSRGLDIERYVDLIAEEKTIRREIGKIAEDYEVRSERSEEKQKVTEAEESDEDEKERRRDKEVEPLFGQGKD
ncbi:hypothetical protein BDN71DRAFT_1447795 [Pleurotus eryngii]|uniref:Calcium uniporter protein, mitochondrial n=1 Tax=Pleurotus eryngii TaxID=5323 RepID=A0A9P6DFY3_PLEER|nr:hypothetical protein BDN71DRAFT_1447795 [Pleurotus eryngii]